MSSNWGRVTAAAILSLSVFGATQYFAEKYRPPRREESSQKPIAYIQQLNDQVEMREVSSLVWKEALQGEPLQAGEAVKTSTQGEVRIQFAESSRFIDLDPESLIVLHQENGNEIALDLLGGSLLVGANESAPSGAQEPALTLKSAQGKVDLTQATAQISKTTGQDVQVHVLKGKAKVENQGQVKELVQSQHLSQIEILSPRLDHPVFLNASHPEPVTFRWKGFSPKTTTSLWLGKTRKSLKEIDSIENSDSAALKASVTSGNYFWKLMAKDATGKTAMESPVYRLKVDNRFPPSIVQPSPQAKLSEGPIEFKWLNPEGSQSIQLEIGKDASLKDKIISKVLPNNESFQQTLTPGTYHWRLSASYKDMPSMISTSISSFTVGAPPEAEKPKIPVVISWRDPASTGPQYFVNTPKASLEWTTEQKNQVHSWRLKLAESEESFKEDKAPLIYNSEVTDTKAEAALPKPGRYLAMVEALDEKKEVIASSPIQSLEVSPLPLLSAPEFLPSTGDFKADQFGHLKLNWTPIQGAQEYWIVLMDAEGKEIRRARYQGTSTAVNSLLPGQYQVSVHAVDAHGRESEKKPPRAVTVSDKSGLQAPKFKRIEVK